MDRGGCSTATASASATREKEREAGGLFFPSYSRRAKKGAREMHAAYQGSRRAEEGPTGWGWRRWLAG